MSLKDLLTPKETEEIKPGLFVQKRGESKYRIIEPMVWNGKYRWKSIILGKDFWKHFIWFLLLMYLSWSYMHDTKECATFMDDIKNKSCTYCYLSSQGKIYNNDGSQGNFNLSLLDSLKQDDAS